jgi:Cys-rich four helix bundle protein (predicted Tat secretion target)
MNRRAFFSAAIGTAALVAGGVHALAQQSQDHSGHGAAGIQYPKLASAAAECVLKGQECIDHCIGVVKAGDISIADCMKSVEELVAACNALRVLTISNSKNLRDFARAVQPICQTCETECRKHERHAPCKACAESCAACIDAIRATFT